MADDLRARALNATHLTTIEWKLGDGRAATLVRVVYHKTAPDTSRSWALCITGIREGRVVPVEWRWIDGAVIEDINVAGLKGWQTVTHAPRDAVSDAEGSLAPMLATRMWVEENRT